MSLKTKLRHDPSISRRGFLKRSLVGVGAMTLADRLALAKALVSGQQPLTAADIRGWGVEPGTVVIDSNENPLGPSPAAIQTVARHLYSMNRYDWDAPDNLAENLEVRLGLPVSESRGERRILVEGSSGYILKLVAIVLGIGDGNGETIEAEPGYGQISGTFLEHRDRFGSNATVIRVPTTPDFVHDLDAMHTAITPKTTLIAITNPNNPAGTIVPHEKLVRFVETVPEHITILIDEAYIHFVREPGYPDAIELAHTRENVLVTRTFSKMYGLAGIRIGYVVGSKKLLDRLRFYGNSYGISKLSCYSAAAALDDHAFVQRVTQVTNEGKDYLYRELDRMGLRYVRSHSSFVQVDLGQPAAEIQERLEAKNVRLGRYGLRNNPAYSTLIRFSIGTPEELEVAVLALEKELSG